MPGSIAASIRDEKPEPTDSQATQEQNNYNHNQLDEEEFKHTTLVVQASQGKLGTQSYGADNEKIYHEPVKENLNANLVSGRLNDLPKEEPKKTERVKQISNQIELE